MIAADMREYDYYLVSDNDEYGQPLVNANPSGKIKMCINILTQAATGNVVYESASFIGLTKQSVTEAYIIDFNGVKLKVNYVNPMGRYTQVYMVLYG